MKLLGATAVLCLVAAAQQPGASPVIAEPTIGADLPTLQIVSIKASTRQSPAMGADYELTLRNKLDRGVLGYGIRYNFTAKDSGPAGKTCFSSYSFDPAKPMIGPQVDLTIQPHLARRGAQVSANIDVVLWADGTYQGADSCGMLSKYAAELRSRRATQELILESLRRQGLEKTIAMLQDELGRKQTTDEALLSPRLLP